MVSECLLRAAEECPMPRIAATIRLKIGNAGAPVVNQIAMSLA
jgi:hypothetical protein